MASCASMAWRNSPNHNCEHTLVRGALFTVATETDLYGSGSGSYDADKEMIVLVFRHTSKSLPQISEPELNLCARGAGAAKRTIEALPSL